MRVFKTLDISKRCNHKLIYDKLPESGDYGLDNICILKENFSWNGEDKTDGTKFELCMKDWFDNMVCEGQELEIDEYAEKLHFAGFAYWGDAYETLKVVYEDGETEFARIAFSDWSHSPEEDIQTLFFMRDNPITQTGVCISSGRFVHLIYFHHCRCFVKRDKKIRKIVFPDNMFMHVFAVTLERAAEDCEA